MFALKAGVHFAQIWNLVYVELVNKAPCLCLFVLDKYKTLLTLLFFLFIVNEPFSSHQDYDPTVQSAGHNSCDLKVHNSYLGTQVQTPIHL